MASHAPLLRRPSAQGAGPMFQMARAPAVHTRRPVAAAAQPSLVIRRACACASSSNEHGCDDCRDKKKQPVRRDATAEEADRHGGEQAPPLVHQVLRSSGQPLESFVRWAMEGKLGRRLDDVRVHSDDAAARSAAAIGARAYTFGSHVVFGAGRYQPTSRAGVGLLAHELAHVAQQSSLAAVPPPSRLLIGPSSAPEERQARAVSASLSAGGSPGAAVSAQGPAAIRRQDAETQFDVDLAAPSQADADRLKAMGVELPRIDRKTFEKIAGPLNHAGQALTEGDKKAIAAFLKLAPGTSTSPLVSIKGPEFLLHDTGAPVGAPGIAKNVAEGRGPLGGGVTAFAPRTGDAVMTRPGFFEGKRPTTTEFEKTSDLMDKGTRERLLRQVWNAVTATTQNDALTSALAATGTTPKEQAEEKKNASAQLASGSSDLVTSTALWAVTAICEKVKASSAKAVAAPGKEADLTAGCAGLAVFLATRAQRIASLVTVEIVQESGIKDPNKGKNACDPNSKNLVPLPSPAYTDDQYQAVVKLYLRAALAAGAFPRITTHFAVDAFVQGHCDPRCFNLSRLYNMIATPLGHVVSSQYGDMPSFGTRYGKDNIWWSDRICAGKPPGPP